MDGTVLIAVGVIAVILFFVFKNNSDGPSSSTSRSFVINFDKDVTKPLKLAKANFSSNDYNENYDRIVSFWTLGYIHGYMGLAMFQNYEYLENHSMVLEKVEPLTDTVLKTVFGDKELADFGKLEKSNLSGNEEWVDGYEWGWRDCESWQSHGEITRCWQKYISGLDPLRD